MTTKLTVFYDGACPLCSREIDFYRTKEGATEILWVDISAPEFDPAPLGLSRHQIQARFHAQRQDGSLISGVAAFAAIWEILEGFTILSALARNRFFRPIMDLGYICFAVIRPYLPRRRDCTEGACRLDDKD